VAHAAVAPRGTWLCSVWRRRGFARWWCQLLASQVPRNARDLFGSGHAYSSYTRLSDRKPRKVRSFGLDLAGIEKRWRPLAFILERPADAMRRLVTLPAVRRRASA
jgi:hypothetical protein